MEPAILHELTTALRTRLTSLYGRRLRRAIVFGSHARGQAGPESDLDILVVLAGLVDRYGEYRRLSEITVDLMEQFGVYVAPVVTSEEDYREGDWPLLLNIREEGVSL